MNLIPPHEVLNQVALSKAREAEDLDRITWDDYYLPARQLRSRGYSWTRIYDLFSMALDQHGYQMPGDLERFRKAMCARIKRDRQNQQQHNKTQTTQSK